MKKELTEKDCGRISLIFAIFMANDIINYFVGHIFETGGMIVSLSILVAVCVYNYKTMVKIKFPALALTYIIIVTVYYLFTRQVAVTTIFGRYFVYYFLMSSILGMYKCNTEKLLRYLSCGGLLIILPLYNDIFVEMTSSRFNTHISMGLSYSMLPVLLAGIVHFIFYREKTRFYMYIVYVIAAFLLINLIMKGNRGILLSVFVFAALIFVSGLDFNKKKGINNLKLVAILIVVGFLIVYFYDIIKWANDLFKEKGIEMNFLNKIIKLEKGGDVSNGRSFIYDYTISEIIDKPFLGHGIGTILYNSGWRIVYAHNAFLQLLYDGGVLLIGPVVLGLVQALYYTFMGEDREEAVFTLFLISVCLPRVMVSTDIWENDCFWLLVMHSFKYYVVRKKRVKVKNQRDVVVKRGTFRIEDNPSDDSDDESVEDNQLGALYD